MMVMVMVRMMIMMMMTFVGWPGQEDEFSWLECLVQSLWPPTQSQQSVDDHDVEDEEDHDDDGVHGSSTNVKHTQNVSKSSVQRCLKSENWFALTRTRSVFHPKWKRKTFRNYWMDPAAAAAATIVYGNRGGPIPTHNLLFKIDKNSKIFICSQKESNAKLIRIRVSKIVKRIILVKQKSWILYGCLQCCTSKRLKKARPLTKENLSSRSKMCQLWSS